MNNPIWHKHKEPVFWWTLFWKATLEFVENHCQVHPGVVHYQAAVNNGQFCRNMNLNSITGQLQTTNFWLALFLKCYIGILGKILWGILGWCISLHWSHWVMIGDFQEIWPSTKYRGKQFYLVSPFCSISTTIPVIHGESGTQVAAVSPAFVEMLVGLTPVVKLR